MRILGGQTITVYRPTRDDRHGDVENDVLVGTIEHVVTQPVRVSPNEGFGETVEVIGILWCPRDSDIRLEDGDRVILNGNTYRCVGPRVHDEDHPGTGSHNPSYGIRVEAVI